MSIAISQKWKGKSSMKPCKPILIIILILLASVTTRAQDIFELIRSGDLIKVTDTIDANPKLINSVNSNGMTPLCFAIAMNNIEMVKMLLEEGSLVRIGDNNLRAPIHFANWNKNRSMIELLLANGAVIDTRAIGAATPLIHASLSNDFEMSQFLIEKGADIHIQCNSLTTPLYFAVMNNNPDYLNYLIAAGAEIDVPDFLDRTPLFIAVRDGNRIIVEQLFRNGADLFRKDKFLKRSLLHIASIEGHNDVVEFLIQHGLDINEPDGNGYSPLDYAMTYGHQSTAAILTQRGAQAYQPQTMEKATDRGDLKIGEAAVIKLQNGSWGIRTKNNFFILGYSEIGAEPEEKSLLNGYITPDLLRLNTKFVCIDHDFHPAGNPFSLNGFNPLLPISTETNNITFIFNFRNDRRYSQYAFKQAYFPKPGEKRTLDDLQVAVLQSFGNNLCYILEANGITIVWLTGISDNYLSFKRDNKVISELLERKIRPDILLLGSPAGIGPEIAHGIRESYFESSVLNPGSVFVFGHEPLERKVFYQVYRKLKSRPTHIYCADNPGDRFIIKALTDRSLGATGQFKK